MDTLTVVLLSFLSLAISAISAGSYFMLKKEYYNYRRAVPNAEALLDLGSTFWIEEYPDKKRTIVRVGDIFFEDPLVYRAALHDVAQLELIGISINEVYYSYRNIELPKEVVKHSLQGYYRKLIYWQDENQGRPDMKRRPKPPYWRCLTTMVSDPFRQL